METNVNLLTRILIAFIILAMFANVLSLTNPLLQNSCSIFDVKACYPPPLTGTPSFTGFNVQTTKAFLLTPIWLSSYAIDTFGLLGSVIFGGFSINLGAINFVVYAVMSIMLFILIILSLPILIEFGKALATVVQGFFQLLSSFVVALGASSATSVGYGPGVLLAVLVVSTSILFGLLI